MLHLVQAAAPAEAVPTIATYTPDCSCCLGLHLILVCYMITEASPAHAHTSHTHSTRLVPNTSRLNNSTPDKAPSHLHGVP